MTLAIDLSVQPEVKGFFDPATNTISYVVRAPASVTLTSARYSMRKGATPRSAAPATHRTTKHISQCPSGSLYCQTMKQAMPASRASPRKKGHLVSFGAIESLIVA